MGFYHEAVTFKLASQSVPGAVTACAPAARWLRCAFDRRPLPSRPRSLIVIRTQHVLQRHYNLVAEVHLHLALAAMSANRACVFGLDERTDLPRALLAHPRASLHCSVACCMACSASVAPTGSLAHFLGATRAAGSVPAGKLYAWDDKSTYVRNPPYFEGMPRNPVPVTEISHARVLAILG